MGKVDGEAGSTVRGRGCPRFVDYPESIVKHAAKHRMGMVSIHIQDRLFTQRCVTAEQRAELYEMVMRWLREDGK
jgi:hypothetical protein